MLRSDFGSALMSGAQKSGALELVGFGPLKVGILVSHGCNLETPI